MILRIKRLLRVGALAALLVNISAPATADLGKIVETVGTWELRRSVDAMTDKITCLATHQTNARIQLYDDVFYIGVKSVPKGFRFRFDDDTPSEMQLPTDVQQEIRVVGFEGADFSKVIKAKRLRVQVLTYAGLEDLDLDLTGSAKAQTFLTSERCR